MIFVVHQTILFVFRYINFARLFKPKLTEEAAEFLVEQYKHLRQRDTGGGVKSSWRITVRQLESLIRLSEAMARVHADAKIRPSYVREVCRLLKASNINIVKTDLEFEDN